MHEANNINTLKFHKHYKQVSFLLHFWITFQEEIANMNEEQM